MKTPPLNSAMMATRRNDQSKLGQCSSTSKLTVDIEGERKLVCGAALGNCVHVAGVASFLQLAEAEGFRTLLMGAAVSIDELLKVVENERPHALAISYRLTPQTGKTLLDELLRRLEPFPSVRLLFGGTREIADYASATGRFVSTFVGEESVDYHRWTFSRLRGEVVSSAPQNLETARIPIVERLRSLARTPGGIDMPLLRHHFGLPNLNETVQGIEEIADSRVVDVISVAPDQNAQEFFFRPDQMHPDLDGAGGVPLRTPADLRALFQASTRGNNPLLRIYSGTQDLIQWAEMAVNELQNAWGAVPLTWYSEIDGRSRRSLSDAISENMCVMKWYGERRIPLEVNESHHWSLRDAPDSVAIAMAYIAAHAARSCGVGMFIAQYMFNTPRYTNSVCDLAKMLAKLTLVESLRTDDFVPFRQCRAGLSHFSNDLNMAKGQLANATTTMLGLRPHIVHVVGYSEASHAAGPAEVIESCQIARGVLKNASLGMADPLQDERVVSQAHELLAESMVLLNAIHNMGTAMGSEDPFSDPLVLAEAIHAGLIDAPHLKGQPGCQGAVVTLPVAGRCQAVDSSGQAIGERERVLHVLTEGPSAQRFGAAKARTWLVSDVMQKQLGIPEDATLALLDRIA